MDIVLASAFTVAYLAVTLRLCKGLRLTAKNLCLGGIMCAATLGPAASLAMVAIATSIVVEICWVIFMDSVLFNRKRMERELARESGDSASVQG